ncbi:18_t:CDS:2 [Diversispora eburnea]|uniref:18_t:CDS:1 n=1 Tax=Diversispora eburnea TaxID=1213867 RepID=A0A9N9FJ88_9GLOM|nr:18_t:CDS:2 [Diversispora eburnea]
MSQEIEKIKYCPAGHSSMDFAYSGYKNSIRSSGRCNLCTKEHFIQEFKTWTSGNANIDKIIQESQINFFYDKIQWIPYNFQNIKHIADGGYGSVNSAKLGQGVKWNWNFIKQDWEYDLIGRKVALKEIKDSRYDIVEFLKVIMTINDNSYDYIAKYYGISKNPSTQNYILVMDLFDDDLHNFLTKNFWDLGLKSKIEILGSIASVEKLDDNIVDNNVMRQLKIADENQKNTSKSQKQELFELFCHSSKLHPQSCYISRYIHTLHGLHDSLEEIKAGKSSDPNILKSNETT